MSRIRQAALDILERIELDRRKRVKPERCIPRIFERRLGYPLNLENPQSYNEKLQWLKLYWHDPILPSLVDKLAVKDFVREKIGEQYVIPTLGVWDSPESIPWDSLPDKFVLKCTHDSGGIVICKDKAHFDRKQAIKTLRKSLRNNFYYFGFEWPYKDVKPRIIMEPYLQDESLQELRDYKFFCFDGEVVFLLVSTDRFKEGKTVRFDYYDTDFNHLPFAQGGDNADVPPPPPAHFEQMKEISTTLSQGFPHVRVDLYEVNDQILFGEMTFFNDAGWARFVPEKWDFYYGQFIKLPEKNV